MSRCSIDRPPGSTALPCLNCPGQAKRGKRDSDEAAIVFCPGYQFHPQPYLSTSSRTAHLPSTMRPRLSSISQSRQEPRGMNRVKDNRCTEIVILSWPMSNRSATQWLHRDCSRSPSAMHDGLTRLHLLNRCRMLAVSYAATRNKTPGLR